MSPRGTRSWSGVDAHPDAVRAWRRRLPLLAVTLGRPVPAEGAGTLAAALDHIVDAADRGQVWLALAVLSGRLPGEETVVETSRRAGLDGGIELVRAMAATTTPESASWGLRVNRPDEVLCDVGDTVRNSVLSGIQRVVYRVAGEWAARPEVTFTGWTPGFGAMRALTPDESAHLTDATRPAAVASDDGVMPQVIVPWGGTVVVGELAAEPGRASRLRALARFSAARAVAIGYDCIPLTTAETVQPGMVGGFAAYLTALRHFDAVAPISTASATEFEGWRRTLAANGIAGPQVTPVTLPIEVPSPTDAALRDAGSRLRVAGMPLVLVVGSHEPRKNHLAVLDAAERLWRDGSAFSMSFVGGNAWHSENFVREVGRLAEAGRPVEIVRGLPDPILWAAYRLARFTVFPSLNEGFGLPVAESLAVGTPAVTSDFGSMADIASGGGAVTVNPRDGLALARVMDRLLHDDLLVERLRREALGRRSRTWREYADELWAVFASG